MDAKGGIYVTDPQFTPEPKKSQPGKQVYYIAPDGSARVVIGPGEFAMPNGVEISPDGRTLYVNNTWQQPGENFVWAYDVAPGRIAVEQAPVRHGRSGAGGARRRPIPPTASRRVRTDRRSTPRDATTSRRRTGRADLPP